MLGERPRGPSGPLSRRDFVAAAVAIGGASALSACRERERPLLEGRGESTEFPRGTDPAALPDGQHVWNEYLAHDGNGDAVLPRHQLVLGLRYVGSVPPTHAERVQVEGALSSLERAVAWGTGADAAAPVNDGLLFLLGYSQRFFERLGGRVDGLLSPEEFLARVGEDPSLADGAHAVLVLNSDFGSLLLAAEAALRGERATLNGSRVSRTFEGVFEVVERRTGVAGTGLPAEEFLDSHTPADAPPVGARSGAPGGRVAEDRVTIRDGRFAGGTTLLASRFHVDLERWDARDSDQRDGRRGVPVDGLGGAAGTVGRSGSENGRIAGDGGRVEPGVLRRTEGVATDAGDGARVNVHSVQRSLDDVVAAGATTGEDRGTGVPAAHRGVADYLEARVRGTFLVPPRARRALPAP